MDHLVVSPRERVIILYASRYNGILDQREHICDVLGVLFGGLPEYDDVVQIDGCKLPV